MHLRGAFLDYLLCIVPGYHQTGGAMASRLVLIGVLRGADQWEGLLLVLLQVMAKSWKDLIEGDISLSESAACCIKVHDRVFVD